MFGLKKSVNSSSDKSRSDFLDKELSSSGENSKFIYYGKTEQFMTKIEIYVKPNNYPNKKELILIRNEADFKELNEKIAERFKLTQDFKRIEGLKIENLSKIQNESRILLPTEGFINEYIKSGDIIYCDIISEELWIKTYFKIMTYNFKKIVKLEFKFKKKMKFRKIKLILLKAGIELFWDELKNNSLDNTFNYYVKNVVFNNKKRHKSQTGFELIDFSKKIKYLDNKNEILVNLQFGIFEELIHKQLISMSLNKKEHNYYRLNEYCNLVFEELLASKKFEPELGAIQDISRDFLTSQYNDLNTSFFFYNIKKKETVDEYIYSPTNDEQDLEEDEEEDDEEDDEFDFEGDTSFGKFYSDKANESFGNITSIKQSKNSEYKNINNNKFDSNMIIVAPFLFNLVKIKLRKDTTLSNPKNANVFRTFAHQNKAKTRNKIDINNFFISPMSLDTNDNNNILKDDQNNLLYNGIDNEENDLILDIGTKPSIYDENNEDIFKDYFDNENKNKNNNNRFFVKYDDKMSHKSKESFFNLLRLSKQSNCCSDLYNYFSQFDFIATIKKKYKYYISKKAMNKIIIPESKDYESVDSDFVMFLQKKEKEEDNSTNIKITKLIIFIILFVVYYILIMLAINML